jgi:N-acetylglucosamine-6-sulfatase
VTSRDAAGNAATSTDLTFETPQPPPPSRPNIVLIMSDNQSVRSVSEAMTHVRNLLVANGVSFEHAHVPYPLCCPARATFLTGQYSHNNNVMSNLPPTGGYEKLDHVNTLPVWLQSAGYYTAHIGKYLNGYGSQDTRPSDGKPACTEVPPGWDEWYGNILTDFGANDYVLNENGSLIRYGNANPTLQAGCTYAGAAVGFQTDVYTRKAIRIIEQRKAANDGRPFFVTLAYGAPEGELTATRHINKFSTFPLPTPPSFNEADVSDKPAKLRNRAPLTSTQVASLQKTYRAHLESLLGVDEGVRDVMAALQANGQLDNTVVFYLSDQGQMWGEHRLTRLGWPYEESVRIPLYVRGPGFPAGTRVSQIVSGVDIAPTIVALAGATPTRPMDGRSLLPLAQSPSTAWRTYSLMEANTTENSGQVYSAVRDARYVYIEHASTGETELYDLEIDPFQLASKHADPGYATVKQHLQAQLAALRACTGSACWR